jgi:small subunit ribosomal protein S18
LGASVRSSTCRVFSTTSLAATPPREAHHGSHPSSSSSSASPPPSSRNTPSSTSSLLSLNRPDRRSPGNSNRSDNGGGGPVYSRNKTPRAADAAARLLNRFRDKARSQAQDQQAVQARLREQKLSDDYLREMPRRWQGGDVYSPHDLSHAEMKKWRYRSKRNVDVVDALGIRPLDMYKASL